MNKFKLGDTVTMTGQTLAANPHYQGKKGVVREILPAEPPGYAYPGSIGSVAYDVFWNGTNMAIVCEADLELAGAKVTGVNR